MAPAPAPTATNHPGHQQQQQQQQYLSAMNLANASGSSSGNGNSNINNHNPANIMAMMMQRQQQEQQQQNNPSMSSNSNNPFGLATHTEGTSGVPLFTVEQLQLLQRQMMSPQQQQQGQAQQQQSFFGQPQQQGQGQQPFPNQATAPKQTSTSNSPYMIMTQVPLGAPGNGLAHSNDINNHESNSNTSINDDDEDDDDMASFWADLIQPTPLASQYDTVGIGTSAVGGMSGNLEGGAAANLQSSNDVLLKQLYLNAQAAQHQSHAAGQMHSEQQQYHSQQQQQSSKLMYNVLGSNVEPLSSHDPSKNSAPSSGNSSKPPTSMNNQQQPQSGESLWQQDPLMWKLFWGEADDDQQGQGLVPSTKLAPGRQDSQSRSKRKLNERGQGQPGSSGGGGVPMDVRAYVASCTQGQARFTSFLTQRLVFDSLCSNPNSRLTQRLLDLP